MDWTDLDETELYAIAERCNRQPETAAHDDIRAMASYILAHPDTWADETESEVPTSGASGPAGFASADRACGWGRSVHHTCNVDG
jgi:hypothetical protein